VKKKKKIGSLSELKTPVKICLFLDNQREKMDLLVEYTEIYSIVHRKEIREVKTREKDRNIKASLKKKKKKQ
jgi:hypothetical protein